jgi:hypothetical protein
MTKELRIKIVCPSSHVIMFREVVAFPVYAAAAATANDAAGRSERPFHQHLPFSILALRPPTSMIAA